METSGTNSISSLLNYARQLLIDSQVATLSDAQVLLAHLVEKPRAWLFAHPEYQISASIAERFIYQLSQLSHGLPLAYLTGKREFFSLPFEISPLVLVPRPETELLVERAISWLEKHPEINHVVDVGTGSGCISAAIARNNPLVKITAVDLSMSALDVAGRNFQALGISEQVHRVCSDLLTALQSQFHLVCANLPYIPTEQLNGLLVSQYEPLLALDGGKDGLDFISRLLEDAPRWITSPGIILLEIEENQSTQVENIARACLPGSKISLYNDLSQKPRLLSIEV